MEIIVASDKPITVEADALVVGVFASETASKAPLKEIDAATGGALSLALEEIGSKAGSVVSWPVDGLSAKRLILTSLGDRVGINDERLRRTYGAGVKAASKHRTVAVVLRSDAHASAAADGIINSRFDPAMLKTKGENKDEKSSTKTVKLLATRAAQKLASQGQHLGESVALARELVTQPPNDLGPQQLAARAKSELNKVGVEVEILTGKKLEKFGGLKGVAQGSSREPAFIIMKWAPPRAKKGVHLGLVGKGVTFDSGGLSLKPNAGMVTMKADMAGAAAVVAAMRSIALLKLPVKVTAVCPVTENMPSGNAVRVGDVLRMYSGTTVEVLNTDAEGRLILADGLAWIAEQGVTHMVDVATLTGSTMVALAGVYYSVLGRPDNFVRTTIKAAQRAGERGWHMPLTDEHRVMVRSEIADIRNSGAVGAGMSTAAAFLEHFVPDEIPWAHLDIAGSEWGERKPGQSKGATGVGVRTLVELAKDLAAR